MTYPVFPGGDKEAIAAFEKRQRYELSAILRGSASRTIYLNGGSDTRRDVFEHYRELFEPFGVPVAYFGWCVVIGRDNGAQP